MADPRQSDFKATSLRKLVDLNRERATKYMEKAGDSAFYSVLVWTAVGELAVSLAEDLERANG